MTSFVVMVAAINWDAERCLVESRWDGEEEDVVVRRERKPLTFTGLTGYRLIGHLNQSMKTLPNLGLVRNNLNLGINMEI